MHGVSQDKSVLLVEDHPLVANAIGGLLTKLDGNLKITTCGCASSAIENFFRLPEWFRIFLDLDVPGAFGLSLARRFCELGAARRCAVITASDNSLWVAEAKALGMLGYILKAAPLEDFTTDLRSVLDGHPAFSASLSKHPTPARLTRRQQDVLSLLHRGFSSKQIAAQLKLTEGTVDNHVTGILRGLDVANRTHAIARAIQLGYIQLHDLARSKARSKW